MSVLSAAEALRHALAQVSTRLPIGTAAYILNPLDYAWDNHRSYITRYAPDGHRVKAILLGMNPGPFGMSQTGIPFGTSNLVRDFLRITGDVLIPEKTHPKRPIIGVHCTTQEVSGTRLWGTIQACFETPEAFFKDFYVANYCPLAFQTETGANLTPDKLPKAFWDEVNDHCERHLAAIIEALAPETVIGIGKWAEDRAKATRTRFSLDVKTATILHPSPASPAANRGWRDQALVALARLGYPWQ